MAYSALALNMNDHQGFPDVNQHRTTYQRSICTVISRTLGKGELFKPLPVPAAKKSRIYYYYTNSYKSIANIQNERARVYTSKKDI
jgi:hypothetical protein